MTPVLVGYFPKLTRVPSDWKAANVVEMCSVSACCAAAPENWIDRWLHNDLGFFGNVSTARSLIPQGSTEFSVFAYRLFPERFDAGVAEPWNLPALAVQPLPPSFQSLGFDVVSKSVSAYFECSPLSCNSLAEEVGVNQFCLLDSIDSARTFASEVSRGNAEPGPYYIVEVLREKPAA